MVVKTLSMLLKTKNRDSITLACTRSLADCNKQLLANAGILAHDVPLISFTYMANQRIRTSLCDDDAIAIITSQHAIKSFRYNRDVEKIAFSGRKRAICVGEKTTLAARDFGFDVIHTLRTIQHFPAFLSNFPSSSWHYYTSNIRIDQWLQEVDTTQHTIENIECYFKSECPYEFDEHDGLLLFSPSQFEYFMNSNTLSVGTIIFCIGETTADFVKSKTNNTVFASPRHTEEALIQTVINYYT